jgi:ATP-dependent exoDNAse (exonuclease V) beta subunit
MDAAIKQLLGEKEPDTLPCSYRSRPALVSHTSELFVRGFADQSISEHRVRLEAAKSTQPRGLGPHLECWTLNRKDQDPDAAAVAAGVIELLNDPSVKVRDQDTNRSRRVEPKDIAVLSRRNDISAKVATALKDRGVRTVRSQAGLAATLEGQVVMAGLEL